MTSAFPFCPFQLERQTQKDRHTSPTTHKYPRWLLCKSTAVKARAGIPTCCTGTQPVQV